MQNCQPTHTEEEIRNALESATVHTAIQLWEKKDWETYKTRRDLLISLIRSGQGDAVLLPQMQFVYFVNTHLRAYWPSLNVDRQIFLAGLPRGRTTEDLSWQSATRGEFWSVPL